jgi:threonine/homoserine/homoserine lactone efflux protein
MIPLDTALTFFGVSVLLGVSPGPDNLFVLMQSATHGRRAGMLVTLGLCTGLLAHTAAVALGVAAVLAASPVGFAVVKLAGTAYLLYLAWSAFRAPVGATSGERAPALSPWRMYGRGVLMNLTNPKVAIFFLAFLPQFVQADAGPVGWQVLTLGGLFILATLLVFGGFAWGAGGLGSRLQHSVQAQRALNRVAGTVFAALAVRLAWSDMGH